MAGLINYYNASKFHYLYISEDEELGRHLGIMSCEGDLSLTAKFPIHEKPIELPDEGAVYLRANVDFERLVFSYSLDGESYQQIDVILDASVISDEAGKGEGANFTGAFIGMCCQDLTGMKKAADFEFFHYREDKSLPNPS